MDLFVFVHKYEGLLVIVYKVEVCGGVDMFQQHEGTNIEGKATLLNGSFVRHKQKQ